MIEQRTSNIYIINVKIEGICRYLLGIGQISSFIQLPDIRYPVELSSHKVALAMETRIFLLSFIKISLSLSVTYKI